MSRIEDGNRHLFAAWAIQQTAALIVPFLIALFTGGYIADRIRNGPGYPFGSVGEVVWDVFLVWGLGLYLGLGVHRFFPRSAVTGRWVWVVPTVFLVYVFISDARMSTLEHALSDFFHPGPEGENQWLLLFVTYPTSQCLLYSLAMFFAPRRAPPHAQPDEAPVFNH